MAMPMNDPTALFLLLAVAACALLLALGAAAVMVRSSGAPRVRLLARLRLKKAVLVTLLYHADGRKQE